MCYFKKLIYASLFLMAHFSFSQVSKFSLEANFPISTGNNFFGNYNGIVDIGAKFRVIDLSHINFGIGVNGSYFKMGGGRFVPEQPQNPEITNFTILPKIFVELDIDDLPKIHPFFGMGYGFLLFNAASHTSNPADSVTEDGLNLNVGVYYLFTKNVFVQIQYDYVKLAADRKIPNTSFNTNVSIIKFGLGVML